MEKIERQDNNNRQRILITKDMVCGLDKTTAKHIAVDNLVEEILPEGSTPVVVDVQNHRSQAGMYLFETLLLLTREPERDVRIASSQSLRDKAGRLFHGSVEGDHTEYRVLPQPEVTMNYLQEYLQKVG